MANKNTNATDVADNLLKTNINTPASEEKKKIIGLLFLERKSLAGISRVTGVSTRTIQIYVNERYGNVLREISVTPKKSDD